jgi:eukaryotic-like serine/threonine-protein kinase
MPAYEPGQILGGKYRLIRQLGRGGMGSVWLAHHATLNAPVALKVIEAATLGEASLQRFLGEARMAAALRSPHVVQILDYGVDEGTPHIAMEVLEGETLAQRLARVRRLSAAETARVVQQVVRAIGRAHDAGVVHRDLKPENIFIVRNDDDELIKVLDFGIAKASPGMLGTAVSPETRTGSILGTPYYMSPEQVDGVKSIDHRADIWALGVVAYQCLLGQLPFQGDSIGRLVLAICTRPLPVPSRVGSVPEGFDAWFARTCARDVVQRFSSARQSTSEFLALSDGQPSSAPADGAPLPVQGSGASGGETRVTGLDPLRTTTGQAGNSELPLRAGAGQRRLRVALLAALALGALLTLGWRLSRRAPERPAVAAREPQRAVVPPAAAAPAAVPPAAAPAAVPPAVVPPAAAPASSGAAPVLPAAAPSPWDDALPARSGAVTSKPSARRPAAEQRPAKPAQPAQRAPAPANKPSTRVPSQPPADLDLGI